MSKRRKRAADLRAHGINMAIPILTALVVLAVWEVVTRQGLVAAYILPAPTAIVQEMIDSWQLLLKHARVTLVEVLIGYLLALSVGTGLALAMVYITSVERIVLPWIVAMQAVPKVAVGPLFVVWFGFGLLPKVIIAFLIAVFPILVNTLVGLKSTEPDMVYLLRSMGAGRLRIFWYLQLPVALPSIFSGMRVAVTLATIGALVGEFVGANEGLGYLVLFANGIVNTTLLFAALVVIVGLSLLLYSIVSLLDRVFIPWHVSRRSGSSLQATP